jgi:hypothetical protein
MLKAPLCFGNPHEPLHSLLSCLCLSQLGAPSPTLTRVAHGVQVAAGLRTSLDGADDNTARLIKPAFLTRKPIYLNFTGRGRG